MERGNLQHRCQGRDSSGRPVRVRVSIEKTRVSDLKEGFQFLSQRVRYKWHRRFGYMPRIEIPTSKRADLRYRVKQLTARNTTQWSLPQLLQRLNPLLRGWGNYYRFCTGASRQFSALDFYVGDCIWRWLMKSKRQTKRMDEVFAAQAAGVRSATR